MHALVLLLLPALVAGALLEDGAVRVRYGSPVRQAWARLTLAGPTRLPFLPDSASYSALADREYVALDTGPFVWSPAVPGPPVYSLAPALARHGCLALAADEVAFSGCGCAAPAPCGGALCTLNTTHGAVELFAERTVLTPDLAARLRRGERVGLGPLVLYPGLPAELGPRLALAVPELVRDHALHLDLARRTLCVEPRRVRPHSTWCETLLAFLLVLVIIGTPWPRVTVALAVVVPLVALTRGWPPLVLGFPLAGLLAAGVLVHVGAGSGWALFGRGPLPAHAAWAALWWLQFHSGAASWAALPGLIVAAAWTWAAARARIPPLVPVVALALALTARNPLLLPLPAIPALLATAALVLLAKIL